MKLPISVLIITKNEEEVLEECLQSVYSFASEIIIVDSYSTDKTVAIAKKFTKNIFFGKFSSFKEKRMEALKHASEQWILFLDADERVSPELAEEIREEISRKDACDGYYIPFKHYFLGKWLKHGGWYPSYLPRLAKREKASIKNPIHELLCIEGSTGYLKNDMIHLGDTSLFKRVSKTNMYTTMQAAQRAEEKKPLLLLIIMLCFMPPLRFIKIYFVKLGFLDGVCGFIRAYLYMYTWFLVYMKEIEIIINKGIKTKSENMSV